MRSKKKKLCRHSRGRWLASSAADCSRSTLGSSESRSPICRTHYIRWGGTERYPRTATKMAAKQKIHMRMMVAVVWASVTRLSAAQKVVSDKDGGWERL